MSVSRIFSKAANDVFKSVSLDDWKTYLRWHLVNNEAPALSSNFEKENFDFFQKALTGVKEQKPRWKRVVTVTDGEVGFALGKLYVAENFPPEAKARALEMINNLKEALADDIKSLDWMDEPTKQEALKKLAAMRRESWLSRQMARLLVAQDRSRFVCRECHARATRSKSIAS